MIITNIKDCGRYECLNPAFAKLFEFIKSTDFNKLPEGRNEIDGDALFVNNVRPDGKGKDEQPLETHRKYIDVHFLISGTETIGWKATEDINGWTKPYDETSDCALTDEKPTTYVNLLPGEMAIVWPEDAHAPAISEGKLHKVIAKVLV